MLPSWSDWGRVYNRLDRFERAQITRLMRARLNALRCRRRRIPVRVALAQAGLSFTFLAAFPPHPMAMPAAYGLALVVLVWVVGIKRAYAARNTPPPAEKTPGFNFQRD